MDSCEMPPVTSRNRLVLAMLILCACIGCDQATKQMATHSLKHAAPRSFLADTVRLEYAQNPGGFLSLGSGLPESMRSSLFIATNLCMLAGICVFLIVSRKISLLLFVSLTSILAGGVGNLIDRITNQGLVTDFINLGIGPLRTGIFNVADIAVTFGACLALVQTQRKSSVEPDGISTRPNQGDAVGIK